MVGLIVLVIIITYFSIALFFIYKVKGLKKKVFVSLIFILIPTADDIVGHVYFSYLCNTQAGQFVYKRVEVGDEYLLRPGEIDKSRRGESPDGFAIAKGGEINKEKLRERYDFPFSKKETFSKIFHIYKRERIISDKINNNILSKSTSFLYGGGWVVNIYPVGIPPCYCKETHMPTSKANIHARLFDKTFIINSK